MHKTDIDWRRGRLHLQRTVSNSLEPCKDGDDRWVKASPALLAALRQHIESIDLEGQVAEWTAAQRQLVFPTAQGRLMRYSHFLEHIWQPLLAKSEPHIAGTTRQGTVTRPGY
jgi:hypothetical protein